MPKNDTNALIQHARDFLSQGGSPARALLRANGHTQAMRTNDLLRKDEWELLDQTLVGIARQRLNGINDLRNAGLTVSLGGLGVLFSEYEKLGDMSAADVDFAAVTDGEKDGVTFELTQVPIPIVSKSFTINIRRLLASQQSNISGPRIDATTATVAAGKVTEQLEELLFNGFSGGTLSGSALYGYSTEPNINTASGSDFGTATNVESSLINGLAALDGDNYFLPNKVVYVPTTQFAELRAFHTDGSGDSVLGRALRINGILDIRPGDRLTAGTAYMVSFQQDVVDLAIGQEMTVVEWEEKGGLQMEFKVMAALAARVKSDDTGGSGVTSITGI